MSMRVSGALAPLALVSVLSLGLLSGCGVRNADSPVNQQSGLSPEAEQDIARAEDALLSTTGLKVVAAESCNLRVLNWDAQAYADFRRAHRSTPIGPVRSALGDFRDRLQGHLDRMPQATDTYNLLSAKVGLATRTLEQIRSRDDRDERSIPIQSGQPRCSPPGGGQGLDELDQALRQYNDSVARLEIAGLRFRVGPTRDGRPSISWDLPYRDSRPRNRHQMSVALADFIAKAGEALRADERERRLSNPIREGIVARRTFALDQQPEYRD